MTTPATPRELFEIAVTLGASAIVLLAFIVWPHRSTDQDLLDVWTAHPTQAVDAIQIGEGVSLVRNPNLPAHRRCYLEILKAGSSAPRFVFLPDDPCDLSSLEK